MFYNVTQEWDLLDVTLTFSLVILFLLSPVLFMLQVEFVGFLLISNLEIFENLIYSVN